jgi:type II restriction enzyme
VIPSRVNLQMPAHAANGYTSNSQRARRVTEAWGETSLYCCACVNDDLTRLPENTRATDFLCDDCKARYQLKSQKNPIASRVLGSNYERMLEAIQADLTPHFYLLHYQLPAWIVRDLLLIPRFVITPSVILPRKPLRETARRKHWQGYTLDLDQIPTVAKIPLVSAGNVRGASDVRADFARLEPVRELKIEQRGWTLDVLRCVESLPAAVFRTEDAYGFGTRLAQLHPDNRHIREKIRQQLQVLRDAGFIEHVERGVWRRK